MKKKNVKRLKPKLIIVFDELKKHYDKDINTWCMDETDDFNFYHYRKLNCYAYFFGKVKIITQEQLELFLRKIEQLSEWIFVTEIKIRE